MNAMLTRMFKAVALLVLAGLLVGALALAFPLSVVSAAGPAQEPPPPAAERAPDPARLAEIYSRQLRQLEAQADRLERNAEMVARVDARILTLKEAGKDTSALEEALADFEAQIEEARLAHEEAAKILTARDGFDADGSVTDAAAAKETVKSAGQSLRDAAHSLRPAVRDLLRALREFRRDNR